MCKGSRQPHNYIRRLGKDKSGKREEEETRRFGRQLACHQIVGGRTDFDHTRLPECSDSAHFPTFGTGCQPCRGGMTFQLQRPALHVYKVAQAVSVNEATGRLRRSVAAKTHLRLCALPIGRPEVVSQGKSWRPTREVGSHPRVLEATPAQTEAKQPLVVAVDVKLGRRGEMPMLPRGSCRASPHPAHDGTLINVRSMFSSPVT